MRDDDARPTPFRSTSILRSMGQASLRHVRTRLFPFVLLRLRAEARNLQPHNLGRRADEAALLSDKGPAQALRPTSIRCAAPLGRFSMAEIDQAEIRRLYKSMLDNGKSHAAMKKTRGALSPLFNTAIEERVIDFNPVTGVKIPAPPKDTAEDEDEERGKALKRTELGAFLGAVDPDWRLFFEFLTVTGLRIGEAIGFVWRNAVLNGDEPRIRVREQIYKGRREEVPQERRGQTGHPTNAGLGRSPDRPSSRDLPRRRLSGLRLGGRDAAGAGERLPAGAGAGRDRRGPLCAGWPRGRGHRVAGGGDAIGSSAPRAGWGQRDAVRS